MAWTTPRTWATGEVVTAAIMNVHVKDNQDYLKTALDALAATVFPTTLDYQINVAGNANSGTAETSLFSYTVPANTLSANDKRIRVTVSGQCSNDADNKVFRFYLGGMAAGTPLWDSGNTTINDLSFTILVDIVRVGVGSQYSTVSVTYGDGAPSASYPQVEERTSSTEDETTGLAVEVTGQSSVGGNKIFAYSMLTELAA